MYHAMAKQFGLSPKQVDETEGRIIDAMLVIENAWYDKQKKEQQMAEVKARATRV
jgi:hypothetical protein